MCFFSSNLSPTPHHPPCNLNTRPRAPLYLSPSLSPSPPGKRLTSLCLLTCTPLFLFLISPPNWQISIVLEDLHKPLTSHFLAEMAFLTICTVSDHTERPMNAALIPIFSTDSVRVRKCSQKKKKRTVFSCPFFPFLENAFLTLVLLVERSLNYSPLCSERCERSPCICLRAKNSLWRHTDVYNVWSSLQLL